MKYFTSKGKDSLPIENFHSGQPVVDHDCRTFLYWAQE